MGVVEREQGAAARERRKRAQSRRRGHTSAGDGVERSTGVELALLGVVGEKRGGQGAEGARLDQSDLGLHVLRKEGRRGRGHVSGRKARNRVRERGRAARECCRCRVLPLPRVRSLLTSRAIEYMQLVACSRLAGEAASLIIIICHVASRQGMGGGDGWGGEREMGLRAT